MGLCARNCGSPVYIPFLPTCHLNHNDDIVLTCKCENTEGIQLRSISRSRRRGRGRGKEREVGEEGAERGRGEA